jgi:excisionase family DNA binding protein
MKAQSSFAPVEPTPDDIGVAQDTSAKLAGLAGGGRATLQVGREKLDLPPSALKMLVVILGEFAKGRAVALSPIEVEVSTQRAADILNVSRPYLVQLLEAGEIPFRKVGTHRRVRLDDVLAYQAEMRAHRERMLDALAAQAQELGLYG